MNDDLPEGAVVVSSPDNITTQANDDLPEGAKVVPSEESKSWWQRPVDSPMFEYATQVLHQAGKGIPIVGQFSPETDKTEQFRNDHPIVSALARGVGAIGTAAPLSAAAALPEAGVGLNMLAQGGLFGGLGTADKAAQKASEGGLDAVTNTPASEYASTAAINAAGGALGPALGKIISPSAIAIKKVTPNQVSNPMDYSDEVLSGLDKQHMNSTLTALESDSTVPSATANRVAQITNNINKREAYLNAAAIKEAAEQKAKDSGLGDKLAAVGGALGGGYLGGWEGSIAGMMALPYAKQLLEHMAPKMVGQYTGNQIINNPNKQAILNALIGESANSATNH